MKLRILGSLEIVADGRSLPCSAPSQRALLAILLLRANHMASIWSLIDELWVETRPAKPEFALRMAVSRLRRLLAEGDPTGQCARLITRPGGYLLQVAPDQVDAHRFEHLVEDGRRALAEGAAELAAQRLDAALALWRGPALASVPASPLVVAESARLEAARVAALETRIEADLACGRHLELLSELEALVAAQPLQEWVRRQWMLALYRAGRQADALEAYRDLRQRLVEGLGIEPGPALQQLERQILTADPALMTLSHNPARPAGAVAPLAPPRQLPHASATFTDRQLELTELCRVLTAPRQAGSTVIAAIHGSAGVGKSALAIRAAHEAAEQFPDGQLYVNLQGASPGLAPLASPDVLGRMLRALGLDAAQVPSDVQEAAARFRSLASGRRLLVVLDNAHDAQQVRPLLPASPTCGVLITSRQMLAALEGAQMLRLEVLSAERAVELLGRIAGPERIAAEPQAAAAVAAYCGLLPLAIQIAGARLVARPGWPVRTLAERLADTASRLDELANRDLAVRASFEISIQAVEESQDPIDRAAGAAFGLLGLPDDVDVDVAGAARLLGQPEPATRVLLERLADAHLLETSRPGRYQFHDLMRLFAREQVTQRYPEPERLAALTRLFEFYNATAWRAVSLLYPGERCPATADPRWTDGLEFADEQAALDWLEAVRPGLLAAVHQVANASPALPAELAIQLTRALTALFVSGGYWSDVAEAAQIALRLARRTGDRVSEAHVDNDLGRAYWRLEQYEEATLSLRESLAIFRELGDRHGQACSVGNLGLVYDRLGRFEEALDCLRESLAIYQGLGDRYGQVGAYRDLGDVLRALDRTHEARTHWRNALALCEVLRIPEGKEVRAAGHSTDREEGQAAQTRATPGSNGPSRLAAASIYSGPSV
jgi:DNA-binding SARP family transcriptional activator